MNDLTVIMVAPEDVHYISGDTDAVTYGEGTGGSRSAAIGGSAVYLAAGKVLATRRTRALFPQG